MVVKFLRRKQKQNKKHVFRVTATLKFSVKLQSSCSDNKYKERNHHLHTYEDQIQICD